MSTTAANAALGPLAGRYLSRLQARLAEAGMRVPIMMMTCAGGVLPTEVLNDRPVYALFSGPAAGVIGSQAMGGTIGAQNVIATDIGGTSFDVGVIVAGKPAMRSEISLAGADLRVHSVDVDSIGAGGGSIAKVENGELRVGPKSAGSYPGPACYGRGGTLPTATDADLVLGVLDAENFLGGRMKLDAKAARQAIDEHVARPLGIGVVEAAWGIRQVLDSRMSDLLRRMTVERGYNPLDFTLFANGGAGPSHAWVLSAELGLDGFVVPAAATAQSAYGTGNADLVFSAERPVYLRVAADVAPGAEQVAAVNAALEAAGRHAQDHLHAAAPGRPLTVESSLSMRFRGQTNAIDVPLVAGAFDLAAFKAAKARFEEMYDTLFGQGASNPKAGNEILSVRVVATSTVPVAPRASRDESIALVAERDVYFDDHTAAARTRIYKTSFPQAGTEIAGPAIIEFPGQSVVVPPGATARADASGNLHVRRQ
jgi:N-methylhydantoinase A